MNSTPPGRSVGGGVGTTWAKKLEDRLALGKVMAAHAVSIDQDARPHMAGSGHQNGRARTDSGSTTS